MKHAVEARVFSNGRIVAKVRPAREGEIDSRKETSTCEIWVDVFEEEREAQQFCRDYKKA